MGKKYSPAEFAKQLSLPPKLFIYGFVRRADDFENYIRFSYDRGWQKWIDIAVDALVEIEVIATESECSFVRLEFKEPKDATAALLADLLRMLDAKASGKATGFQFWAACGSSHNDRGPWYGPCRDNADDARRDQESHNFFWPTHYANLYAGACPPPSNSAESSRQPGKCSE